jgi:hypothetical protein
MWRIRHDLGLSCMALGNAGKWLDNLEELGYPASNTPKVHDVLILEPGEQNSNPRFGHVAMVLTTSATSVSVEQYDWTPCQYSHGVFQVTSRTHFVTLVAVPQPTPPEDDDLTTEQAAQLQQIWAAIFEPTQVGGTTGYPTYAPGNNIDIIRRKLNPYNVPYPPPNANPPTEPTP